MDTFETDQTWTSQYDWWDTGANDNHGKNPLSPTNGMSLINFRRTQSYGDPATGVGVWTSSGNSDQSIITNAAVDLSAATNRATGANTSVPGAEGAVGASTSQQYVVLDTQGDTVSRSFTQTTLSGTSLYVDTMIQFTASEDFTTTGLTGAKLALWVNKNATEQFAAGDLIVYAEGWDEDDYAVGNYVLAQGIDAEKWYRLTIQMMGNDGSSYFRVLLDGVSLVNNTYGSSEDDLGAGSGTDKSWFRMLGGSVTYNVSEVAFQGTGAIDNLVVTDYEPSFAASAGALITLIWGANDGIASVMLDGEPATALATGDTVGQGDTVTITAADWHGYTEAGLQDWAAGVASYGSPANISLTTNAMSETIKSVTFTVASVAQAGTVALPVAAPYTSGSITVGTDIANAQKAAEWATIQGVTEANFASVYSQYLLNIDATATDPALVIDSIEKTPTGLTITVSKAYTAANAESETAVDLGTVNGTVVIRTADTLAGLATAQDEQVQVTVVDGKSTITVTTADDAQFVKVWVK
ncbi:MAG: hypothetical protein IJR99_03295 [Kiritimatiellae bacterium]|nr:hypothetical protein [Kiritimatiellia bacterium]